MEPTHDSNRKRWRWSGGGYNCPHCNSRTGWSYIKEFGKEYGKCFACGIRNLPSMEKPKPLVVEDYLSTIQARFVRREVVNKTLKSYDGNPFIQFLKSLVGEEKIQKTIEHFFIGTAKNEGTVFWYIDAAGNFRRPKIISYNSDGKRKRDVLPHSHKYTNANGYNYCLYGEHQLHEFKYPKDTHVILVESEKTAIIGYLIMPQHIWLAIGGVTLSKDKAAVLLGRAVTILPDAHQAGRIGAQRSKEILDKLGVLCQVVDLFPGKEDKSDIADYILEKHQVQKENLLIANKHFASFVPNEQRKDAKQLLQKHTILIELIKTFDLEIHSVGQF